MEDQVEKGKTVNQVALQEVLREFEELIESGQEIISVDAELDNQLHTKTIFAIFGIAAAFLMFASMYAMLS
jgi:flagellar motor switch protein FliG